MKRITVLLACAAVAALLLLPATASAAYTTNVDCLKCHDATTGSGAVSKVDFGAAAVNYAACYTCHRASLTQSAAGFRHNHPINFGADCSSCHAYITYSPTDMGRLPYVNTGASGYFYSAESLSKSPAELHAIHVNGSWPKDIPYRSYVCAGCHASASCSTCHAGTVAHGTHSSTKVVPVTYTTAFGQLLSATVPNIKSETISCVTTSCHALAAASVPEFKPFCASTCHKPPMDSADRTLDHGYSAVDHTATVSTQVDPGEVKPCGACHSMDLMTEHARSSTSGPKDCSSCHPAPENTIIGVWNKTCLTFGCHVAGTPTAKHGNMASAHATVTIDAPIDCYTCHKGDLAAIHAESAKSCLACHSTDSVPTTHDCTVCHTSYHANQDAKHTSLSSGCTGAPGCHPSTKLPENHALYAGPGSQNPGFADECALCHDNPAVDTSIGGACQGCHPEEPGATIYDAHWKQDHKPEGAASAECVKCHGAALSPGNKNWVVQIHNADGYTPGMSWDNCATCHNNPTKRNMTWNLTNSECANCHASSGVDFHKSVEASHAAAVDPGCVGACHPAGLTTIHQDATTTVNAVVETGCFVCHNAVTTLPGKTCETCHFTFPDHYDSAKHTSSWAPGSTCGGEGCHVAADADLKRVHNNFRAFDCMECHGDSARQAVKDAIAANDPDCDACHAGATPTEGHRSMHYADPALAFDGTGGYAFNGGVNGEPKTRECAQCHEENLVDEHLGTKRPDGTYDKFPQRDRDGKALECATCHGDGAPILAKLAVLGDATNCDACHTIHGQMDEAHASTYVTSPRVPCAPCHVPTINTLHQNMTSTTSSGTVLTTCAICHSNYDGAYGQRVQDAIGVTNDTKCSACHDAIHADPGLIAPHTTTTTTVGALDCKRCHDEDAASGVNVLPVHGGSTKGECAVCHDNSPRVTGIASKSPACVSCHTTSGSDFHRDQNTKHTFAAMGADCQEAGCHSNRLDTEHAKYMSKPANAGYIDSCALCHENTDPDRIDWDTATADCASCHTTAHPPHTAAESDDCLGAGCHATSADLLPMHANSSKGACNVCHNNGGVDKTLPKDGDFACAQVSCHLTFSISSHTNLTPAHRATATASKDCAACHQPAATTSVDIDLLHRTTSGTCALSLCHKNEARIGDWSNVTAECASCHSTTGAHAHHTSQDASHTYSAMSGECQASGCHSKRIDTEHDKYMSRYASDYATSCLLCHANKVADRIPAGATAACSSCHTATHPPHTATASPTCVACHETNDALVLHAGSPKGACAVCHGSNGAGDITGGKSTFECAQTGCHANRFPEDPNHYSDTTHTASPFTPAFQNSPATFDAGGKECTRCHSSTLKAAHAKTSTSGGSVTCVECHTDTRLNSKAIVAASWPTKKCVACHDHAAPKTHATYASAHVVPAGTCASTGTGCHDYTDLAKLHDKNASGGAAKYSSCWNAECHDTKDKRPAAINSANSCGASNSSCHNTGTYHPAHIASNSPTCIAAGCHVVSPAGDVMVIHVNSEHGKCAVCHGTNGVGDVTSGKTTFDCAQSGCHTAAGHPPHIATTGSNSCTGAGCHATATRNDVMQIHVNSEHGQCAVCHGGATWPDVTAPGMTFDCAQSGCHTGVSGDHHALHDTTGKIDPGCAGCHYTYLDDEHSKLGYTCDTCHGATAAQVVKDAIKANDVTCDACHPAVNGKDRHAAQNNTEFIPGNSSGHRVSSTLPWAKTSFLVNGATYTWPLPATSSFLKAGWTTNSVVTCDKCHTFSGTAAGPHGAAVTVNIDPAYPTDWKTVYFTSSSTSSSNFICAKCHTNFLSMNEVHRDDNHNGREDGQCVRCHTKVPHGWRLPRLLAYTTDPAPYASLNLTSIKLKSYTPTNWSESDCGQSGCGEHNSSVSPKWPSTVQAPAGTLTGYVRTAAGAAISGATVAVTGDGSATTDSTGKYTLSLPAGVYTATASKTGYSPAQATVTITSAKTTTQDFALAVVPVSSNVALGKSFTATSEYGATNSAAKAGDGSTSTWWRSRNNLSSSTANQMLTVDLGGTYSINKAVVYWYSSGYTSYHARNYRVRVSTNGSTWTDVATVSGGSSGTKTHTFATALARYVRIDATSYNTSSGYGVSEFQVWTP